MCALHQDTHRASDQKQSEIKGESLSQQRLLSHALPSAPLKSLGLIRSCTRSVILAEDVLINHCDIFSTPGELIKKKQQFVLGMGLESISSLTLFTLLRLNCLFFYRLKSSCS